jgi:hypothetical protein
MNARPPPAANGSTWVPLLEIVIRATAPMTPLGGDECMVLHGCAVTGQRRRVRGCEQRRGIGTHDPAGTGVVRVASVLGGSRGASKGAKCVTTYSSRTARAATA